MKNFVLKKVTFLFECWVYTSFSQAFLAGSTTLYEGWNRPLWKRKEISRSEQCHFGTAEPTPDQIGKLKVLVSTKETFGGHLWSAAMLSAIFDVHHYQKSQMVEQWQQFLLFFIMAFIQNGWQHEDWPKLSDVCFLLQFCMLKVVSWQPLLWFLVMAAIQDG